MPQVTDSQKDIQDKLKQLQINKQLTKNSIISNIQLYLQDVIYFIFNLHFIYNYNRQWN